MPSLDNNNDNNVQVNINTNADTSGIDQINDSVGGMTDGFSDNMKKVGIAAAAVGVGLTAFSKSSVDYLSGLVKSSKTLATQTGMTIQQSSALIQVFAKLGVNADQAGASMKIFAKNIANAQDATGSNALATETLKNKINAANISITAMNDQIKKNGDSSGALTNKVQALQLAVKGYQQSLDTATTPLEKLDVATKNADGTNRSFNDILLNVADKFHDMPDGVQKTAIALQLFGRSGTTMIKVLNQGSQGIQDLEAEAQKLGLTLTSQNVGAINDYIKSQRALEESTNSMKIAVGTLTAPIMTNFNNAINHVMMSLLSTNDPARGFIADVLAFGGPIIGATIGIVSFASNLVQAWPAIKATGEKIYALGAAAVSTTGDIAALDVIAAIPIIIEVTAALAALAAVVVAIKTVIDTYKLLDSLNTQEAKELDGNTTAMQNVINDYKAGRITKAQEQHFFQSISARASGGPVSAGTPYKVGEQGEELFIPNQSGTIINANQTKQMSSNKNTIIHNVNLGDASAVDRFFDRLDRDNNLVSKGLSPARSA